MEVATHLIQFRQVLSLLMLISQIPFVPPTNYDDEYSDEDQQEGTISMAVRNEEDFRGSILILRGESESLDQDSLDELDS